MTSDLGVRGVAPFGRRPHPPFTPRGESLPARHTASRLPVSPVLNGTEGEGLAPSRWLPREICASIPVMLNVRPEKLLRRLTRGELANVRYSDLERLLQRFGFHHVRSSGSHRIFSHPEIPQLLNLQNVRGEVKPYQVRQFLRLVEWYDLHLEDRT